MASFDQSWALILAAGRGTRMGGPKALMDVRGRPWWEHQHERLERVGIRAMWVVSPEVLKNMTGPTRGGVRLPDTVTSDPTAPMFTSLLAGLSRVRSSSIVDAKGGVFILPVDVPAPALEVWECLGRQERVGVPSYRGVRGHPVFLAWPWARKLMDQAAEGTPVPSGLRLDTMIGPDASLIDVDDPDVAVNLNTPDDVARWLARAPGRGDTA